MLSNARYLLLDLFAIVFGTALGACVRNKLSENTICSLRALQGLICLLVAVPCCTKCSQGNLSYFALGILIASFAIGNIFHIGELVNSFIVQTGRLFCTSAYSDEFKKASTESLLISITGSLAVLASVNLASGDWKLMAAKAALDFIGTAILSSANGPAPIAVSGIPIMIFQSLFYLLGYVAKPLCENNFTLNLLSGVSAPLLVVTALALLGVDSKLKSENYVFVYLLPFAVAFVLHTFAPNMLCL